MSHRIHEVLTRATHVAWLTLLTTVVAACGATADKNPTPPSAPGERIGTYDGRAVVIAYANSELFRQWLDEVRKRHDEAAASGDKQRADELQAQAIAQQDRFHAQAFDGDDIGDVLDKVANELPVIRQAAGVVRLEPVNRERPADALTVDVTDQLVALFHPDDRAKGWIADIRSKPFPKH